jgi:hypothetical protein
LRRRAVAFLRRVVEVFRGRALDVFFTAERRRVVVRGREGVRRLRGAANDRRVARAETFVKTTARGRSMVVPVRVMVRLSGL